MRPHHARDPKPDRKFEDTNGALGLSSLDHRARIGLNGAAAHASVMRLIELDLGKPRVELLGWSRSWGAHRRSGSGCVDRRRGNRKDVKVVDLEFDRAVFVIPFADGAHVVRVAVGRGDGFLDDGAVFEIGIGVTVVLVSKRVLNTGLLTAKNRKHA